MLWSSSRPENVSPHGNYLASPAGSTQSMRERCCQLVARTKGSTFIHLNGTLLQAARGTCDDNLQFAVTHARHVRIYPASFGLKLGMNGIHRHRTQSDLTREFGPLLFYIEGHIQITRHRITIFGYMLINLKLVCSF